MPKYMHPALENIYLDWVNNYLSIARFAEAYNLTHGQAVMLIDMLRENHEFHYGGCNRDNVEIHGDTTCPKYNEPVLPDENGNCSLCGAQI